MIFKFDLLSWVTEVVATISYCSKIHAVTSVAQSISYLSAPGQYLWILDWTCYLRGCGVRVWGVGISYPSYARLAKNITWWHEDEIALVMCCKTASSRPSLHRIAITYRLKLPCRLVRQGCVIWTILSDWSATKCTGVPVSCICIVTYGNYPLRLWLWYPNYDSSFLENALYSANIPHVLGVVHVDPCHLHWSVK